MWTFRDNGADALFKKSPLPPRTPVASELFRNFLQTSTAHPAHKNASRLSRAPLFHQSTALITTTRFLFLFFVKILMMLVVDVQIPI
jgi:hypothetical protein